jgi:NADH-quinone oxidoreductase subunit E
MFEFCQTSCLSGTEDLMDYTCEKLGKMDEITADGLLK